MKIRSGFVSNSSSSSFCIFGVVISERTEEIDNILWEDRETESICLECNNGLDEYGDCLIVGIDPRNIDRSKTLDQIAEEVVEKLKKLDINVKSTDIDFHMDQGYDS
jgi:hypothetical protein